MKRIATIVEKGKVVGLVHGPDFTNQHVVSSGRIWKFDFDEMFGPLWLNHDGYTPKKNQNPPKTVWREFERWLKIHKGTQ